jgi:hypothetical protein
MPKKPPASSSQPHRRKSPLREPGLAHRLRPILAALLLVGLLWCPAEAQTAPAQEQSAPSPQTPQAGSAQVPPSQPANPKPVPGAGLSVQEGPPQAKPPSPQPAQPETRITKAQAKELFRSVDEILRFASQDTGLPIEHRVKRKLITREAVEKYVQKHMRDDKDTQRMEQSRLVLEKFGLIPRGYDLHSEFLRVLGEQVAAFYDAKSKSVDLLDWVSPETQKPVLAHELTHALQDQKIDLEKWELAGAKDEKPLPDQQEYAVEERQAARQCVTEGQAMVVLLDYSLAPMGKSIADAPEVVDAMRAGIGDNQDSPVFAAAPMFLRESLLMPYTFGLDFVRTVLAAKGKEAAFGGMLEKPPVDTRQVMQPETYLLDQVAAAPVVPDLDKLVAPNYERFDFGSMGEFDVYLLAKQYGADEPKDYYPHWRGGYYFAARGKSAPKEQIAMLYFSHWDSPEAARAFAKLYAGYLPKRYRRAVAETPAAGNSGRRQVRYTFASEEGKAIVESQDTDVLIMEGFDENVIERARAVLFHHMPLPVLAAQAAH